MPIRYSDINDEMVRMYFKTISSCIDNYPKFICYSPYYSDPDKQTIVIYYTVRGSIGADTLWRYVSCQRVIDICKEIGYPTI